MTAAAAEQPAGGWPGSERLAVLANVGKRYGSNLVLEDVSLTLEAGCRHAITGENGAGKSTLIKVLSGGVAADAGSVTVGGRSIKGDPLAARAAGVAVVHQHLSLVPTLSVEENVVLGQAPTRLGFVSRRRMRAQAREVLDLLGLDLDPGTVVADLSFAERQLLEIGKAVARDPQLLLLDEPTAVLTPAETERLFALLDRLQEERGTGLVYVSHRIPEIYRVCRSATVLRDGRLVADLDLSETAPDQLIRHMVGREVELLASRDPVPESLLGGPTLAVRDLHGPGVSGVSFEVRAGEVVGIGGLVGAGRSELAALLFGLARRTRGQVRVDGEPVGRLSPSRAMRLGLALVPEDRQRLGLALTLSAATNAAGPSLRSLSPRGIQSRRRTRKLAEQVLADSGVRPLAPARAAAAFSGGNQQKIVLGRWLPTSPRLLILDEPTAGVDVEAKSEIHRRIDQLARDGTAVLMISSDLPELLTMADRVLIMREGRLTGTLERSDRWAEEEVVRLATVPVPDPALSA